MEPASKASVYTSSSGLSQPGAEYPGQGDIGSLDQQEQQQEQEQAAPPPLTDTIAMGLQNMEDRRLQIHAMVRGTTVAD